MIADPVEILLEREHPFKRKPADQDVGCKMVVRIETAPRRVNGRGSAREVEAPMHDQPSKWIPLWAREDVVRDFARVDVADVALLEGHRWRHTHYGYAITGTPGKEGYYWMHRLLLGLRPDDARQSDHRNGDRLDNRRANLRVVTLAQNAQNRAAIGGSSKHRGVSFRTDTGRWTSYCDLHEVRYTTGCFATEQEAVDAVLALRAKLFLFDEPGRHS